MSIVKTLDLFCDNECGNWYGGGTDDQGWTASRVREAASREGWRRYLGKDFCPTCMEDNT